MYNCCVFSYNWFWHCASVQNVTNWPKIEMMTHGCSPFTFWLILNNELLVPAALKASSITLSFCFLKHFLGIVIYCSAWNSSSLSLNRQWWHSMHQFASRAWHLRCFHVTHRKSSPKTDMYYLYNLPILPFHIFDVLKTSEL